jgi:cobalamin synthase
MEIFGILLSIPAAFVLSMLYCLFLAKAITRFDRLVFWLWNISFLVLALFEVEIVLLMSLGAVRSRGILGPGFYVVHLFFFFVCTPALANLLVLRRYGGFRAKWYFAPIPCTVLAFVLVLLQYGVSESLYGINGDDGPYSRPPAASVPSDNTQ